MRIGELMIEDLVRTPKGVFRVTAIQDNDVIFTDYSDDIDGAVDIGLVEPVRITGDILLKIGFCTSQRNPLHGVGLFDNGSVRVEYMKSTAQSGKVLGVQLLGNCGYVSKTFNLPLPNFVHELQHAFRYCGIKDKITF
jgi:hypothetical protein